MSYSSRAFLAHQEQQQAEAEGYATQNSNVAWRGRNNEVRTEERLDYDGIPYTAYTWKPKDNTRELWEKFNETRWKGGDV